ncbi:MAG: DUF445 family protein [Clostridiales bacterium]|jgi:uncharacterized membrane protein YheB (UPF0754 family)|nr:DUF445 family protein [Clostridiales bacterium]
MGSVLGFILTPVLGAIIGYFTNWLAIKMLFQPKTEMYIGKFKLPFTPGIIPKERNRLTKKVAETVGGKLLTAETITNELTSPKITVAIERLLDDLLLKLREKDLTLAQTLPKETLDSILDYAAEKMPDVAMMIQKAADNPLVDAELSKLVERIINENLGRFVGLFLNPEKIYKNIKLEFILYLESKKNHVLFGQKLREGAEWLMNIRINDLLARIGEEQIAYAKAYIMGLLAPSIAQAAVFIANNIDVSGMVENKMNAFSIEEAEEIILSVVQRELNAITLLGGVLGFIIGLIPALMNLLQ